MYKLINYQEWESGEETVYERNETDATAKRQTHLGFVEEFCFSSCRNLANADTGLGAGRVMFSITASNTRG